MSGQAPSGAPDGFLSDPGAIGQIAAWLAEAGLAEIEISSPSGARTRILRAAAAPRAPSAPDIPQPAEGDGEPVTTLVDAPYFGRLRLSPTPEDAAFAPAGALVQAGDAVAVIELQTLCVPILAPCNGEIVEILAEPDALIGYKNPVMLLKRLPGRD